LHPIPRLVRNQGRGHDPTDVAFIHQGAREPGAAGAGFVDEDTLRTLRPQGPEQRVNIALPCADRAEGDDLRTMGLGDIGDRHGLLMDIHANVERARL